MTDEREWCNYTWDTIMCWPAIPGASNWTQPCPSMKGLDSSSMFTPVSLLPASGFHFTVMVHMGARVELIASEQLGAPP